MPRRNEIIRHLVLALVLGACPSGCQTPTHDEVKVQAEQRWCQVRGQVKLQLARQQFERGLFEEVVKTLEEASALDPASIEISSLLAKAHLELGRPATAEHVIRTARQAGLDSAELRYLTGVVLEQRGELEGALSEYQQARSLNDLNVDYLIACIESLVNLGRAQDALTLLETHSRRFDDEASLVLLAARIAALMGNEEDALRRYQHPAIAGANSLLAVQELGILLARNGDCAQAIALLQPLCGSSKGRPSAPGSVRRQLAECYLRRNRAPEAKSLLMDHVHEHPEDSASALVLAKAALACGDFLTALHALEAAQERAGESQEVKLLLATTHWKRGDWDSAARQLDSILSENPYDVDAWCLLGEVHMARKDDSSAEEAFSRALAIDPECSWALAGMSRPATRASSR